MNPAAVFKAYDIRGRTDTGELDESLFQLVGGALVGLVGSAPVAIGRDCRASSRGLFEALSEGINAAGADVIDLGLVPTDLVYYYSGAKDVAGAMITASHNPPEYNGLKLCRRGASPIGADTGLAEIKASVLSGERVTGRSSGGVVFDDGVPGYVDHLFSIVPAASIGSLRVAVDGGNGMAGIALSRVIGRTAVEMEGLYLEPDGTFPNHPADPLVPENLRDLEMLMEGGGFDLGVAFDGDADRAFFLDDKGEPVSGSTVTSLIARRELADEPGAGVVHNLITSRAVSEIITEAGGRPIRTRVGHSFIKQVMAETGAIFGGEHSGHYYFRDNYRADSGMLAMLSLMRIVSEEDRPLSELRGEVERYHSSGEVNFEVPDVSAALQAVEVSAGGGSVDHLDGLTVDYGEGWFNLRPSNTEPLLRLNAEAATEAGLSDIVENVSKVLEKTR